MTNEKCRQTLRQQVRQVRTHLLGILDWIESELDRTGPPDDTQPLPMAAMANISELAPAEEQEPLTDRHYWILAQLGQGLRLTRKHVMDHFGYSERHAKRILAVLRKQGLIEFQRAPKPGYYELCDKA